LLAQAREFECIANAAVLNEFDLDTQFAQHFGSVLLKNVRGFGFYSWKPQVIQQSLRALPDESLLVYVDGGSHLNSAGERRFKDYVETCHSSESGILAFQTHWTERNWTKGDLLDHFAVRDNPLVTETGQVQAGLLFLRNTSETRAFVDSWAKVFWENLSLADDSPSTSPNLEGFIEHRHDQSIFSLLAKLRGIEVLSASEQEPSSEASRRLGVMPVVHARDIASRAHTLKSRWRRIRESTDLTLVRLKRRGLQLLGLSE
jgi:hypothetical protein